MALNKELIEAFKLIIVDAKIPKEDKVKYLDVLEQCKEEYVIDVLDKDYISEMGYYSSTGNIEELAHKMSESYCEQDKAIEFNALVEFCGFEKKHKCSVCGKILDEGFHALEEGKDIWFCSTECLHQEFTEAQWLELYKGEPSDYYWTNWE